MAGGFPIILLTFECVNRYPLLARPRHADKGLKVIETE